MSYGPDKAFAMLLRLLTPEQQHALLVLMHEHGIHADDPSIVPVTLHYLLASRLNTILNRIEYLSNPAHFNEGKVWLGVFTKLSEQGRSLGQSVALVALGFGIAVGFTMHKLDLSEEHSRVCAAATEVQEQLVRKYADLRQTNVVRNILARPPDGC